MKLSHEELLKIAEQNEELLKESPTKGINDVHRFINALNIKTGKHQVKMVILYKVYKMWSVNPISLYSFVAKFNQFFECNRVENKKIGYYNLNYRPVELLNKIDNLKIKI